MPHSNKDPMRFGIAYKDDPVEWRRRYAAKYRQDNPVGHLLKSARARAAKSGMEFNLAEEELPIPEYCPIFPDRKLVGSEGGRHPNNYSLDRIDNSKGYVKGNVRIISYYANLRKANWDIDSVERLLAYMRGEL